jgi:hypothetical protein
MRACGYCIVLLGAAHILSAQQTELDSLVSASTRLRAAQASGNEIEDFGKLTRSQLNDYETILRDWIESRLPGNSRDLDARFALLQAQLSAELWRSGLMDVAQLKFVRPPHYPGVLLVQAGVSVPCGTDDVVFLYRFTAHSRARMLESHGDSKYGNTLLDTKFSKPDAYRDGVFYVSWDGVQCASVWNGIHYRLFHLGADSDRALPLFSDFHGYTIDGDANVRLTNEEWLLEVTAGAMEAGFRRTHVLHYRIGPEGVERIDPVALQPQDFVHEWLLRPWDEMQSRSAAALAKWHKFLHGDYFYGEYDFVQPCKDRPGIRQVGVGVMQIGDQEIPEPLSVYFLVEDLGGYRFKLIGVSFDRQSGCPGESYASYDNPPSLFKK